MNLLYDATTTMNLVSFGLQNGHLTYPETTILDVFKEQEMEHWLQPEARYWFCNKMMGSFIGFHALGGSHNIGGMDLDFKFLGTDFSKLKDYRYEEGWFIGAGVALRLRLGSLETLESEAELGVGYIYFLRQISLTVLNAEINLKMTRHTTNGPDKSSPST